MLGLSWLLNARIYGPACLADEIGLYTALSPKVATALAHTSVGNLLIVGRLHDEKVDRTCYRCLPDNYLG